MKLFEDLIKLGLIMKDSSKLVKSRLQNLKEAKII